MDEAEARVREVFTHRAAICTQAGAWRLELVLTTWPEGLARRLAVAQPHGARIDWLDQAVAV